MKDITSHPGHNMNAITTSPKNNTSPLWNNAIPRTTTRLGGLLNRLARTAPMMLVLLAAPCGWGQGNPDCITLTCPASTGVDCSGASGTVVTWSIQATSTCAQNTTVSCNPASGTVFPQGITAVTCVATDTAGNRTSCTFDVNVHPDLSPPVLLLPAPIVASCGTVSATQPPVATVDFDVMARDNCEGSVSIQCVPPTGSVFPIGTNYVTCVATDANGNSATGTFPVIVNTACPECFSITCPRGPIVAPADRSGMATVEFEVFATNRCGGTINVICTPPSGSDFPVGTNGVACVVEVDGVRMDECQFLVVVPDEQPPVIKVPRNTSVQCSGWSLQGQAGRTINYLVTATDNVDAQPQLTCVPPSGSFFPLGTNVVTCTASDNAGNTSSRSFTIVVTSGPACEVVAPDPDFLTLPDNWDFEHGLTGWTPSGAAFETQPTLGDNVAVKRIGPLKDQIATKIGGDYWRDVGYPIGHHAGHWIGTAENHPDDSTVQGTMQGNGVKGWLRSRQFLIEKKYITFLVGGDEDLDKLRVELLVETDPSTPGAEEIASRWYAVAARDTGHDEESLRRELWTVQTYVGRWARIRVVDDSTTGHINVDDFRFQDEHPYWTPIAVGCTNILPVVQSGVQFFDWDAPVWGFADLHTHPMSYLGLGGKLMHGKPGGFDAPSLQMALGDCNCSHGGWGLDNDCGDYYRQLVMTVMDDKGNDPHREGYDEDPWKQFRNWPVFSTITHQQMWHEWIRRAYDGGLRVMVALCVNNELLAKATKGNLAHDDKTVGDIQIDAMKQFAALHSDFCQIAYDPFQLRQIIRENKLAIILGSELDSIGNLSHLSAVSAYPANEVEKLSSETLVRAELERLYAKGLRYIFPVHLVDNKFGGTAVGNIMLNVANKFYNGSAFDLEPAPASDNISYQMEKLDYTDEALAIGIPALVLGPALPAIATPILEATLAPVAPGAGTAIGSGVLPIAMIAAANTVLLNAIGVDPLPPEIWPLGGNFPTPPATDHGHRNRRGLTPLGKFAVKEMMRRGMMIDIDHMSIHTVTNVFSMAEEVPGGYPLNSGHNSARALGKERNENHRTARDYERMFALGGLAGVGFENSDVNSFDSYGPEQTYSSSEIPDDCAGTSKTFGQNYLYVFEKLRGRQIAFGTDIDGFIAAPGPRFGPQSAFGIHSTSKVQRDNQVRAQKHDGVLYSPKFGKPLTTAAFVGDAVDPDRETDHPARPEKGYEYNKDQRDFFAALRIFYWKPTASEDELKEIESALSDSYPNKRRVKEYAFGLVKGVTGADPGSDALSPDTETREKLGKAVYRYKAQNIAPPFEIIADPQKFFRFIQHGKVWDDYQKIFGTNTPMIRCKTDAKEWDINFEGVAHYGLMPDLLQDLHNVGLNSEDMTPLFLSAEHFAQMWVKCLKGAAAIQKPALRIYGGAIGGYFVEWYGESGDILEYTGNVGDPNSWRDYTGETTQEGSYKRAAISTSSRINGWFFRVRRPATPSAAGGQ
jgi:microsomal dipeptidase-like Zn-dependent dipeptidase